MEIDVKRMRQLAGLKEEDVIHNGKVVDRQAQKEHEKVAAKLPKVEELKEKDSDTGEE